MARKVRVHIHYYYIFREAEWETGKKGGASFVCAGPQSNKFFEMKGFSDDKWTWEDRARPCTYLRTSMFGKQDKGFISVLNVRIRKNPSLFWNIGATNRVYIKLFSLTPWLMRPLFPCRFHNSSCWWLQIQLLSSSSSSSSSQFGSPISATPTLLIWCRDNRSLGMPQFNFAMKCNEK